MIIRNTVDMKEKNKQKVDKLQKFQNQKVLTVWHRRFHLPNIRLNHTYGIISKMQQQKPYIFHKLQQNCSDDLKV